jgi:hypothetical protein
MPYLTMKGIHHILGEWLVSSADDQALSTYPVQQFATATLDECWNFCLKEISFICLWVEYTFTV